MTSPPRNRGLAGVLAVVPMLLAVGVIAGSSPRQALAATSLPTLPPLPTPCPTLQPLPTLCPTLTPLPTPVPTPPLPTVLPSILPTLLPTGVPNPLDPGSPAGGPFPTTGPGGTPGSSPFLGGAAPPGGAWTPAAVGGLTSSSPYVPAQVSGALVISDPFLAWRVEQVLQHPISRQRPDLAHFSLRDASQSLGASGGLFGDLGTAGAALVLSGLALTLVIAVIALIKLRRRSLRLRATLLIALAALASPLGAAATSALTTQPVAVAIPASSAETASNPVDNSLRARAVRNDLPAPSWTALVNIEQAIASDHDQLVQTESAISAYNTLLTQSTSAPATTAPAPVIAPPAAIAPPTSVPALDAPSIAVPPITEPSASLLSVVTSRLTSLVTMHDTLAGQYAGDLQREYDFYVATARSPGQQTELLQAASQTAAPDASNAVTYNINTVYTQLAQEAVISAAQAAAASSAPQFASRTFVVPSGPIAFHAPVNGVVSQGFGPTPFSMEPPIRYNGVFYPHFHTGLDIANGQGTPVGAAAPGLVILATSSRNGAGQYTGYGNYVVIAHGGGFLTLYGHMQRLLVSAGQTVQQGQVIGLLGSTGWSTGPHLHFEVRSNGVYVDPAQYIAGQLRR